MNTKLKEKDYCHILFMQCYYTCELYHQEPFKTDVFPSDDHRMTFLLFKSSPRGTVTTKKLIVTQKDSKRLEDLLLEAYPNIEITVISPPFNDDADVKK